MPLSPLEIAKELTRRYPNRSFASWLDGIEIEVQRTSDIDGRSALARSLLDGTKIAHLDIGARGGPRPEIELFAEFHDIFLCEPDTSEAKGLAELGYTLITQAFWSSSGAEVTLNIAEKPSNSSIFEANEAVGLFLFGDLSKIATVSTETLRTTTIHDEETARGVRFDDLKIDAEGADFEILKGLGGSRPFFVESEINVVELRRGQGLLHDIMGLLQEQGYMLADISFRRFNGMHSAARLPDQRRASRGLGFVGDACFMVDWTRQEGKEIIARAPRVWAAVMVLKGYEDILRWICWRQYWDDLAPVREILDAPT